MHGTDMCSVTRFIRMIQTSEAWRHAERVLSYQEEAAEEAEYLRQQLRLRKSMISQGQGQGQVAQSQTSGSRSEDGASPIPIELADLPDLPDELINICEYLGIRVLSEQNMLWIAADALKAPLPVSWTAQKDENGRTFFFNHLTNQSKWEHPLDPHFRKLRDKYRQSNAGLESTLGRNSQTLGQNWSYSGREQSGSSSVNSFGVAPFNGASPLVAGIAATSTSSANGPGVTQPPSTREQPSADGLAVSFGQAARGTTDGVPSHPEQSQPLSKLPENGSNWRAAVDSILPPFKEAGEFNGNMQRPKSALPERTDFLAYKNLGLVKKVDAIVDPTESDMNRETPQQMSRKRNVVQFNTGASGGGGAVRPGSAPAVAQNPTLVPSNGVLYSMTLNKELKPYKPLATNNPYIASFEVRSKTITEPIYKPQFLKPARPTSSTSKQLSSETKLLLPTGLPPATVVSIHAHYNEKEPIVSKKELKLYVSNSSERMSRPASSGPRSRPSSSSKKVSAAPSLASTAVNRAVSVGRSTSASHLLMTTQHSAAAVTPGEARRQSKIAGMFQENVVERLDNIIFATTAEQPPPQQLQPAPRQASHTRQLNKENNRKGGIVIL